MRMLQVIFTFRLLSQQCEVFKFSRLKGLSEGTVGGARYRANCLPGPREEGAFKRHTMYLTPGATEGTGGVFRQQKSDIACLPLHPEREVLFDEFLCLPKKKAAIYLCTEIYLKIGSAQV